MLVQLPPLPYAFDALSPAIDTEGVRRHPTRRACLPVEDWGPDASLGVESREFYGPDGDEVDADEAEALRDEGEDVTFGYTVYGPYDNGGFKPSAYAEKDWR